MKWGHVRELLSRELQTSITVKFELKTRLGSE